jgi:PAS domain S-box-containing protein
MKKNTLDGRVPKSRLEELTLLYQLGILLASGKNLYETLLTLQNEMVKLVEVDTMFVAIYTENTDVIDYPIFFRRGEPHPHPSRKLSERPGLTGEVIYRKKTLYLPDMMADAVVSQYAPVGDNVLLLRTFLGVPLVVNERVIGVLSVQSVKIDAYSKDQIQLMENFAVQAAIAIDKASLFEQLQQELDERRQAEASLKQREAILESVTFSAEQFLKTSDWRETIDSILERLGSTIHASHAYLVEHFIQSDGTEMAAMRYEWTALGQTEFIDNTIYAEPYPVRMEMGTTNEILIRGEAFVGTSSTFPSKDKARLNNLGIKALLEVPLFVNGRWWGTIGFDDFEMERQWSPAEVDALKIAAGILSGTIQRQEAETAVQESERIYRQAIEAADAVPYYQNYQSNSYPFMGEGIRAMTGYSSDEMKPSVWSKLVLETVMLGEASRLSANEAIQLARRGKLKAWKCDQKIRTRDGQIRWLTDRSIELLNEQNVSYGSIGILQDITDRKLTEADLRMREAILEAITFAAEQFLKTANWRENIDAVLERLGKTLNASHAYLFEDHTNPQGELVTSMRYEWTAPGHTSYLNGPYFQNSKVHQEGYEEQVEALSRGEVRTGTSSTFNPIEKESMDEFGVKAILELPIFVNEREWGAIGFDDFEQEREWSNAEMGALKIAAGILSAAIKRQLDEDALQKELLERKKLIGELENKNSELERFTYTVSHDLKSPLVTINGFLGYLEQDAASGNMERLARDTFRIHDAVNKMQQMLNELLQLSRVGRIINVSEYVPFEDLLSEAMEVAHGRLEARGVKVQVTTGLPDVYVDKPRLIEVLQNLLDNAAKYMGDQPDPRIEIGQYGKEAEKPIFYVKDNGIGIAAEYHERVFGLFNKLDPKSEGTGIGLALVKRIIEVHGGRIWVEGEAGKGTTFFFTLPTKPEV